MKKTSVLLIAPTYVDSPNTMYFPIGMAYLASYIESKGYEVDGLNMSNYGFKNGLQELNLKLQTKKYDVIGIGALTVAFEQIEKLIIYLRGITNAKIVIGGGVTSCESELVIQELKPDYMVISEGELIFEELLSHIRNPDKFNLPKGVWSLKNAEMISNNESHAISDLDLLPFPNYELMGISEFMDLQTGSGWSYHKTDISVGKYMPISASRSCPFQCTFCHHAGMGTYRKHSVKYAIDFIKKMTTQYRVKHLSIYDELFSMDKKRVMEFCKELKSLNITFMCQLRVDQVDAEMLMAMKEAGCIEISYGIESGSDIVIKSMNKKVLVKQIENAVRLTKEAKIGIQGNFLFGDPAETKETIEESIRFQEKSKLFFADWSMVIPYPGTVLHQQALDKNIIKDRVQFIKDVSDTSKYLWNKPINLTNFSDEEYLSRYSTLRELNDTNHRKVLSKVIDAVAVDEKHSNMKLECPNCKLTTIYDNLPFPINIKNNLFEDRESFYGFLGINMVCPQCRSKHHLLPKSIEHIKPKFEVFDLALKEFIDVNNDEIVMMPAMDRYVQAVKEDTNLLDIKPIAVLDTRDYRIGNEFLGQKIQKFNDTNISKFKEKKFLILPWIEYAKVYSTLIKNNINENNILSWNKFVQK
ncbi:MAG: B12-binding domain-containing radical SAM protein [Sulfurimonas sp.]|nr:B12-binding domain-containing radical SAM protein [Sulfurimonas sp.]